MYAITKTSQGFNFIDRTRPNDQLRLLLLLQGAYYLLTAVWPLVSIGSFQAVTGRKTDLWLVKTVAVLVSVIGSMLLWGGLRGGRTAPEVLALACGSAAGLTAIDTVYTAKRQVSPIYLLDALIELGLLAAFAHVWWHGREQQTEATARAEPVEA